MSYLQPQIITVKDLLKTENLQIPDYQRPYKWTERNVNQLLDDIIFHKDKSAYRLGTLVIHSEKNNTNEILNIVDGQQRTITLILIAKALIQQKEFGEIKELSNFSTKLTSLSFSSDISKSNIQNNYKVIERRINEFDNNNIIFLFNNCEFVKVVLEDISEAFQFFDSQNSRGKDLEPHDLLKAFHLREMNLSSTEEEKQYSIEKWEEMDTNKLAEIFSQYLYRIRNWSKGRSARYFTKNDVDIFKGISPEIQEDYSFVKVFRIAHYYIDEYNQSHHKRINQNHQNYPFQIDQPIINGKRFFEMIDYYDKLINTIKSIKTIEIEKSTKEYSIMESIKAEEYHGRNRSGDKYIRNLFYCGLIYYIDRFGEKHLDKIIDKIFIWAYTLRLKLTNVGLNSVDNYALKTNHYACIQLFEVIREATKPNEILNIKLEVLKENKSTKTLSIENIFRKMRYYE